MKPYCIWFTGMPNAGKSTIVYHLLQKRLRNCIVIDGDKFREKVNPELSFTRENIIENNKTAIKVIKYLMGEGFNILVAMITPFQEIRDLARKEIDNYIEVYICCPEEIRKTRPSFMASQIPYETPVNSDIILHTDKELIETSTDKILNYLKKRRGEVKVLVFGERKKPEWCECWLDLKRTGLWITKGVCNDCGLPVKPEIKRQIFY